MTGKRSDRNAKAVLSEQFPRSGEASRAGRNAFRSAYRSLKSVARLKPMVPGPSKIVGALRTE